MLFLSTSTWEGFLGGPVVKNPAVNAGDMGSIPEKILHAAGQLSLCATTTEDCTPEPMLHNKRSRRNEKPVHRN